MLGQQPVQALELISQCDPAADAFITRAYALGNVPSCMPGLTSKACGGSQVAATLRRHDGRAGAQTEGRRAMLGRALPDASGTGSTDEVGGAA